MGTRHATTTRREQQRTRTRRPTRRSLTEARTRGPESRFLLGLKGPVTTTTTITRKSQTSVQLLLKNHCSGPLIIVDHRPKRRPKIDCPDTCANSCALSFSLFLTIQPRLRIVSVASKQHSNTRNCLKHCSGF